MTWASRMKLTVGVIVVVALVAIFTVVFTQRQSEVVSSSASIQAQRYEVGTEYSGDVIKQNVRVGDAVKAGDTLFEVRSSTVAEALSTDPARFASSGSYTVSPDGTMSFVATGDGTVSKVGAQVGTFVPNGTVLATIDRAGSLFVESDYRLTPRDYERIERGARVGLMLPDRTTIPGTVDRVTVQTVNGVARTRIRVVSDRLREGARGGLIAPGTPIEATLSLRQDGIFAGAQDAVLAFLKKIGL
ncbi:MAG: HlyD family efflux transporter periplasmic adaptor subunit [Micrococcales bacterium]|nr:HlyD family efflux transporter periplasmic adaptor subunit [Micrococcales bacterium]